MHEAGNEQLNLLRSAREDHRRQNDTGFYDEVLHDVTARAAVLGTLGKADIGALLFWKRLRADAPWVTRLHRMADDHVRAATGLAKQAMQAEDDLGTAAGAGRSALSELPGFDKGDALASAVLTALAPGRMAVYDRHAHAGLDRLGLPLADQPGRYARYMALLADLRSRLHAEQDPWSHRDVDLALFQLGRPRRDQTP